MEKRQTFISRLDENVIITMLAVSVIAFIILAFRVKNSEPCIPFNVRTTNGPHYAGEVIRFETNAPASKKLQWNFGDNRNDETGNASASHIYKQTGSYEVTISANNKCTQSLTVVITQAPRIIDTSKLPTVIWPDSAEVDKPVTFKDITEGATKWEWRFGETATVDAASATAVYTYKSSGYKTVSLIVNDDQEHSASYRIFVNPIPPKKLPEIKPGDGGAGKRPIIIAERPENDPIDDQLHPKIIEPPPAQVTGIDITEEELRAKLRQVADKQLSAEGFSAYLCGNFNIPVSLNGNKMTFTELYNHFRALKSSKKIKDLTTVMVKSPQLCVQTIVVNYKKKTFLGM